MTTSATSSTASNATTNASQSPATADLVAVLISPADLAELEETLDILSDPDALADIREADAAYAKGEVVRGATAVRDLRR